MKKLLSTILALTLCLAMAVPAFAAEINQDSDSKSGDTPVSLTVTPTYTMKIPETIQLEQKTTNGTVTYEQDATITASAGVRLLAGKQIQVTMAPSGSDTSFTLGTIEGATLDYTVTVGSSTAAITSGAEVARFGTSTTEQTSTLHFAAPNPRYAGAYSDTVTFTLSIVDAAGNN